MSQRTEAATSYRRRSKTGGYHRLLTTFASLQISAGCTTPPDAPQLPDASHDGSSAADATAPDDPQLPLKPCGLEERTGDGELGSFVHRSYDERGNHVRSERYVGDTIASHFTWEYSSSDNLTRATRHTGELARLNMVLQYDEDDHILSVTWDYWLGDGIVLYEYLDDRQIVIERWDQDADGTEESATTYTYSVDGTLEEYTFACSGSETSTSISTLEYDDDGRLERREIHREGELIGVWSYQYSEHGSLSRVEHATPNTITYWESYEYDSAGNVTERTVAAAQSLSSDLPSWSLSRSEYDPEGRILSWQYFLDDQRTAYNTYLYDCPGFEDSPGRSVGKLEVGAPPRPGPREKVGQNAVDYYTLTNMNYRCSFSDGAAAAASRVGHAALVEGRPALDGP
jgi:hypothetical protein